MARSWIHTYTWLNKHRLKRRFVPLGILNKNAFDPLEPQGDVS